MAIDPLTTVGREIVSQIYSDGARGERRCLALRCDGKFLLGCVCWTKSGRMLVDIVSNDYTKAFRFALARNMLKFIEQIGYDSEARHILVAEAREVEPIDIHENPFTEHNTLRKRLFLWP